MIHAAGTKVINMSIGTSQYSQAWQDAVTFAWNGGSVLVASAGNYASKSMVYPAGYARVLAVGAITRSGAKAGYSNFGAWVDMNAPGGLVSTYRPQDGIRTTVRKSDGTQTYDYVDGTSFAAPFVAGAAALRAARNPSNASIVTELVRTQVRPADPSQPQRLDIAAALRLTTAVTQPNGSFVKDRYGPAIYLIDGGKKRWVPSHRVLASWGLTAFSPHIAPLDAARLEMIPSGLDLGFRPGTLVSPSVSNVDRGVVTYIVTNDGATTNARWTKGARRLLPLPIFVCLGYRAERVISVSSTEVNYHAEGQQVTSCTAHPNGSIMTKTGDPKVYVLEGGKKRHLVSRTVLASWGMSLSDIVAPPDRTATDLEMGSLSAGASVGYRPGSLVSVGSPVYHITSEGADFARGNKRHLTSPAALTDCYAFSWSAVVRGESSSVSLHPSGADLNC